MIHLVNKQRDHESQLIRPSQLASTFLNNFSSLNACSFSVPCWEIINTTDWQGINLLVRTNAAVNLKGHYIMRPTVCLHLDNLLLFSPEMDATTSLFSSFGSLSLMIGDCIQHEKGSNGLQIIGSILIALSAIILYGASIIKAICTACQITKLSRLIRCVKKQIKAQQQVLNPNLQHHSRNVPLVSQDYAIHKFSDTIALQAHGNLLTAFKYYRAILITNLVEKIIFALLITTLICFTVLASVYGLTALPCLIMGGIFIALAIGMLAFVLVSSFVLRKYIKSCVGAIKDAWSGIVTSEMILKAPEMLRENVSARMLIVKDFLEACAGSDKRVLNTEDLRSLMLKIGFPSSAVKDENGKSLSEQELQQNLLNAEHFFDQSTLES